MDRKKTRQRRWSEENEGRRKCTFITAESRHDQLGGHTLRYFGSFHGDNAKPWLLGIVRNACFTWLQDNRGAEQMLEFDEDRDSGEQDLAPERSSDNPEQLLSRKQDGAALNAAIESLPAVFREVLILRELEELSYDDIARIVGIPAGTVMSRLSRARALLRAAMVKAG
jgi:RNA polymerase sigma factor (sigma-70 family)